MKIRLKPWATARSLLATTLVGGVLITAACAGQTPTVDSKQTASGTSGPTLAGATVLQRDADAIRDVGVTGVQVRLVTANGANTVVTSGVSDLAARTPVPPNGYFRMASATKTFTGTVILQLVAEGRLSLDDTVEKWLPGLVRGNGNDGTRITVRQLLNHTSGLVYAPAVPLTSQAGYRWYAANVPASAQQQVADAVTRRPNFAPGAGWSYSNTGYLVLGMIIEKVAGQPWYTEVERRIIEPLRLTGTSYPGATPTLPDPHAVGYTQWPTGGLDDTTDGRIGEFAGAAGALITTTADLNTFFRALFGGNLLPPQQLAALKQTVDTDAEIRSVFPAARYGLGVFSVELSCGGRYWMHGGDITGYKTRDGVSADGKTSVVVSMSTLLQDTEKHQLAQEKAATALVDHALCGERTS